MSRTSRWLDPATYRRWRDFGLFALERGGRHDVTFQSRSELRDAAFADGLYDSGRLPDDDPSRGYSTCWLADVCGKGRSGRTHLVAAPAVPGVLGT